MDCVYGNSIARILETFTNRVPETGEHSTQYIKNKNIQKFSAKIELSNGTENDLFTNVPSSVAGHVYADKRPLKYNAGLI